MPHELGGPGTMGVADLLLGTGPVVQVGHPHRAGAA